MSLRDKINIESLDLDLSLPLLDEIIEFLDITEGDTHFLEFLQEFEYPKTTLLSMYGTFQRTLSQLEMTPKVVILLHQLNRAYIIYLSYLDEA